MSIIFIALGSNMGKRKDNIKKAIKEIGKKCKILSVSSQYETEPMYVTKQPKFINAVIKVETEISAIKLMWFLQGIEKSLGRNRSKETRFGPRILDLDILLYGSKKINNKNLIIPHPKMKERAFVLIPLYEIHKQKWVKDAMEKLKIIEYKKKEKQIS